ncbi:MAG: hypothetical protein IJ756_04185 [Paludibacteraceae bacterium]|nr:hypothetical protein [Paludibacteraceae bacterium]
MGSDISIATVFCLSAYADECILRIASGGKNATEVHDEERCAVGGWIKILKQVAPSIAPSIRIVNERIASVQDEGEILKQVQDEGESTTKY